MRSILRRFLWAGITAFGAARWTTLESAFVRSGLIEEKDFFRDYAISSTLPGPSFVNLTALCGMRLGGVRVALAAIALVLLPGLVAVVLALAYLSPTDAWVRHLFSGILVGAVAVVAAQYVQRARRMRGLVDAALAALTLVLIALGVPMIVAVVGVASAGVVWYRSAVRSLP